MTNFSGKKRTDRIRLPKQLGLYPEIAIAVRRGRDRSGRSVEMQLLYFILVGIQYDPESSLNEYRRESLHMPTHDGTQQELPLHTPAQPRRAQQNGAQKQGREIA